MGLSYLSTKVVFQHLEANRRYTLAARIPFLRTLHQQLPLTISHLVLRDTSFSMNGFEHTFHTILEHPRGYRLNYHVLEDNRNGGVAFDVDQYGGKDDEPNVTQGDVNFERVHQVAHDPNFEHYMQSVLHNLQEELARGQLPERQEYNSYIQFTLRRGRRHKTSRFPPGIRIQNAIRQHLGRICSSKRILVKNLEVELENGVLRFPEDFRLKILNLKVLTGTLEGISRILDPDSFPVRKLILETHKPDAPDFQNPILQEAQLLTIEYSGSISRLWVNTLGSLPNRLIHITDGLITDMRGLISIWHDFPKPVGTKVAMPHIDVQGYLNVIHNYEVVPRGVLPNPNPEYPTCATTQVTANTELNIYVEKSPNFETEIQKDDGKPWMLVFEIMELGTARMRN